MKKTLALVLAVLMLVGFMPITAKADNEPASVTVYLSVSNDGAFVNTAAQGVTPTVMAMKEITVPYFDIGDYGLEDFYFASEDYGPDDPDEPSSDLEPGTAEFAEGKITMLHLLIYAMERFYLGLPAADCGQGELADYFGTFIDIGGSTGSLFFSSYWNLNYNFNYYLNYDFPLASGGWGATADQILLHDGDIVTVGHFTSWDFYNDPISIFGYAQPTGATSITPKAYPSNNTVNLTFYHAGPDENDFTATAHDPITTGVPVYYCNVNNISSGVVTSWSPVHPTNYTTNGNGSISINTSTWASGTYIVAMPGLYGVDYSTSICCTPGGILVEIS